MSKKNPLTYRGYLQNLKEIDLEQKNEIDSITNQLEILNNLSIPLMTVFIVMDYTKRSYHMVTPNVKNLLQQDREEVMDGGIPQTLSIYHPDDFVTYNENIFVKNLDILKQYDQKDHKNLLFIHNYRLKRKDKTYANLLQKYYYLTNKETGQPLYAVAAITDITDFFPRNNLMGHKVLLNNPNCKSEVLLNQFYFSGMASNELTKQELKIIQHLSDGLSSKQIADKLHLSINTINNHRQNILIKTKTQNVAQLIVYAVKNGIV